MLTSINAVFGGARSGKSALAERLVRHAGRPRGYIATAQAFDDEMHARIAQHRVDRGEGWETIEEPLALADALLTLEDRLDNGVILIDCLTLWLTNILLAERDIAEECDTLIKVLSGMHTPVVCVSNEIGMGLVPENVLGRTFRDAQGRLNQQIAAQAGLAMFTVAGLPILLKGQLPEGFV